MRGTPCLDGGLQKKSQLISSVVKAAREKKKKTAPAERAAAALAATLASIASARCPTAAPCWDFYRLTFFFPNVAPV